MKKIAVVFPGVGYTKDRPLLYYAGKLAAANGYELIHLDFSGIDWSKEKLKDKEFLLKTLEYCLDKTGEKLKSIDIENAGRVLFISKSIGTVVATAYADRHGIEAKQICFTPLEFIDRFIKDGNGLIFYGSADPYADVNMISDICMNKKLTSYCIEDANHSLETGDVLKDIDNLLSVMKKVKNFINLV